MNCIKCKKSSVAHVCAKCADLCLVQCNDVETDGYVPSEIGIGGGDYIEFDYCLDCGQIQGNFPVRLYG